MQNYEQHLSEIKSEFSKLKHGQNTNIIAAQIMTAARELPISDTKKLLSEFFDMDHSRDTWSRILEKFADIKDIYKKSGEKSKDKKAMKEVAALKLVYDKYEQSSGIPYPGFGVVLKKNIENMLKGVSDVVKVDRFVTAKKILNGNEETKTELKKYGKSVQGDEIIRNNVTRKMGKMTELEQYELIEKLHKNR
jgi:hypothetical protein